MPDTENVIIVGSGPAAYTAALYTSRANLKPLIIEGEADSSKRTDLPGGQLMITTDVENFPGFPRGRGASPRSSCGRRPSGLGPHRDGVGSIPSTSAAAHAEGGDRSQETRSASCRRGGREWLIPSEKALLNKGLSGCATCDGALPLFRNKHLAVVGGGDTAMEEATFLTRFASKVSVIHRRDTLRASKIMQEKAKKNSKIEFVWNSEVAEVLDMKAGRVTGLRLRDVKSKKESTLDVGGVFIAIGHEPNTAPFRGQIDLDDRGYVKVTRGSYTSVEGVFAGGDCVDHVYRQAVTAAGMGCMAAIDAERWLETQDTH
jgi:thioredoxin reductase (NADPH)